MNDFVRRTFDIPPLSSKDKVVGDLVELAYNGEFDVIVHGCNCFHTMGAGIAKTIAKYFPIVLQADSLTLYGDRNKLGSISLASVMNAYKEPFTIVNAYTQFQCFGPGPHVDYDAIAKAFKTVSLAFNGRRIAYPLIGCGLAGGDWHVVEPLINEALRDQTHTLVVYNQEEWDKWFKLTSN